MSVSNPRSAFRALLIASPGVAWIALFAIAPLAVLVVLSFWTSSIFGLVTEFTIDNYQTIVRDPVYILVMLRTLRIAFTVTLAALIISYPVAYFISTLRDSMKPVLMLLMFVPFWSSYIVRTFVWMPMLSRNGLINNVLMWLGVIDQPLDWLLFNEFATHIGLVYVYTLFMFLPIYLSLERIDPALLEAASDLGAGFYRRFVRIILPLSLPGVISGCVMVFLMSCGAYVTPQLLGGTSGLMIGNIIASQYTDTNNWALGAALSVMMAVTVFIVIAAFGKRVNLSDVFLKA